MAPRRVTSLPPLPGRRRALRRLGAAALAPAGLGVTAARAAAAGLKVLRYSMESAETGLDPHQVNDIYSRELVDNMFDAPLRFDLLARPARLRPNTLVALPEMSADFREHTLRVRPGILFTDDPAFRGQRRELTAADYAFALRRHYDPLVRSQAYSDLRVDDIVGLQALRERAQAAHAPFDYDAPVPGLELLDRYTLRVKLENPSPRFSHKLAQTLFAGAVAREVCEAYGPDIMDHPVGTGPYRLVQRRASSFLAFERNPGYREETWDEQPAADDAEGQALARRLRGRRLPLVDRVEVSIVAESQPSWLAYLAGEFDFTVVRPEFVTVAIPGGRLSPNLARRGMQAHLVARPDLVFTYFNMEDPVVGGYTPEKVALRRAIALGYDNREEIRVLRRGMALPAQGIVTPLMVGYDPSVRSVMGDFDPERARALLDVYGYLDRDGDGWREMPDGSPLVLHRATETDGTSRTMAEIWQKRMKAIGLRMVFQQAQWPENAKQARAGKLQMWMLSENSPVPDPIDTLGMAYGPAKGEGNFSRFDMPAFNTLYDRIQHSGDGPERERAVRQAEKILLAYMPIKGHVNRIRAFVTQPWLAGYPANPFVYGWWRYADIDTAARERHLS